MNILTNNNIHENNNSIFKYEVIFKNNFHTLVLFITECLINKNAALQKQGHL